MVAEFSAQYATRKSSFGKDAMKRAPDALGPAMEALGEAFKQDAEQWN